MDESSRPSLSLNALTPPLILPHIRPSMSEEQLKPIRDVLENKAALIVGKERDLQLSAAVEQVMKQHDFDDLNKFITMLVLCRPNRNPLQALVERMVINETFFFRDEGQMKALRDVVLPDIVEHRGSQRTINILSAGCSTGEEPYSAAILLYEMLPNRDDWNINIMGLDISMSALAKARDARYRAWSFRGVAQTKIDRYFEKKDDVYQLAGYIKRMVAFQYINLIDGIPFSDVDLILWRNVGIYFCAETRKMVTAHCFRALREGGWLFVGASELSESYARSNEIRHIGDAIVQQKSPRPSTSVPRRLFE